ncbi:hypothetical protein ACFYY8_31175 [Streptosporangium sp. NPDC001559]|uniref:hypothetical protein n=1 Tax=Streptosporangium sp. NPDC001559 TaxID=3366187 RepID=UPI0036ED1893
MTALSVASLVEARPSATEVAVVFVPAGAVVRVHHPAGVREYVAPLPEEAWYVAIPGDRDVIGWGAVPCWYGSLAGIRNGRHSLDREAWHAAARQLATIDVAYVQFEQRDHFGAQRWTAVAHRAEVAA